MIEGCLLFISSACFSVVGKWLYRMLHAPRALRLFLFRLSLSPSRVGWFVSSRVPPEAAVVYNVDAEFFSLLCFIDHPFSARKHPSRLIHIYIFFCLFLCCFSLFVQQIKEAFSQLQNILLSVSNSVRFAHSLDTLSCRVSSVSEKKKREKRHRINER